VSRGDPSLDLIGRAPEVELLDALLDRVEGDGGALVLRGEAGIGKSALLDYASERAAASGFRAVQCTPLFSHDGEPLGMISSHFREPHRPTER